MRNRSTYLPYLLACIVSIVTFYTLLAINNNHDVMRMRGGSIVASFTAIGTVILAIFCAVLLFYTNSFLIKRRKKEMGLFSILGMEKANLAIVMFFETAFVAAVSLVLGLGAGALLARLLYLVLLRLIRYDVMFDLPVSWQAIAGTAAFFGIVFFLTLLSNLRQVRLANPVQLMAGGVQGEKEPKASWLLTVIGLVTTGAGYVLAVTVESPVDALLIFLLAAFLVIIGTFCLFTSGSVALLKLLKKNRKIYYHPKRFITISGMIYRMKQNATGLSAICILSCMVLVTVSATVSLYVGAEDSLRQRYPHYFTLYFNDATDADQVLDGIEPLLEQNNLEVTQTHDITFISLFAGGDGSEYTSDNGDIGTLAGVDLTLMTLDVYNSAEQKNETLASGEALMFWVGQSYDSETLTLDGIEYAVRPIPVYNQMTYGEDYSVPSLVLVLPDDQALAAAAAASPAARAKVDAGAALIRRSVAFDTTGESEAKRAFIEDVNTYAQGISTSETFRLDAGRDEWYATNGGFLFLGIYFGILFLMAASMIIYYKQISEGSDDADRYAILQKVGMSGSEVKKTINSQILSVFFMPLIVAAVHIVFAFHPISRAMLIFGVSNVPLLAVATAGTVLIYALVYTLVYKGTARAYYNIVRMETAP
jgi:putative ABC transport system permease protein